MGHSRVTDNLNLPQFDDTDKPTWLGDVNEGFRTIDERVTRLIFDLTNRIENLEAKVYKP